jgi:hypothetical protein
LKTDDRLIYTTQTAWERYRDISRTLQGRDPLVEHPNPIYTQPVNSRGLSDTDPVFNAVITYVRQLTANGLPPSMVGETYVQLLRMADPEQNVVVASPREPLATQGANAVIEPQLIAENQSAAVPFVCSPA